MTTLLDNILSHPDNKVVFDFFELPVLQREKLFLKSISESNWIRQSEGLTTFFKEYAKQIPDEAKYLFNGKGMLINPDSGEIFSVQFGQFEIAFKCDLKRSNINDSDELRTLSNLDGIIADIRPLGVNWALGINFVGNIEEQLLWAYERTK